MGGAIALAASRTGACEIYIFDKDSDKARALAESVGGTFCQSSDELYSCRVIFLATKPNILPVVAESLAVGEDTLLVSMAAGVKISRLRELFARGHGIIRIMPNTPVAVGSGTVVYCKSECVTDEALCDFLAVMACAGLVEEIDEELIDAETAVAGCGPAFVYMFAAAMAEGGVRAGLAPDAAKRYAASVIEGAAKMLARDPRTPEELCRAVCSPGGSTIEGVKRLESGGFAELVTDAVLTSYNKTKTLGK